MNIAEVSSTFPPYMGGTGNVCYHNSKELANIGHRVTVYTSNYPKRSCNYPKNITVKRFNCLIRIGNAFFIPQLIRTKNHDIIHLHYPFFFGAELIYLISKFRSIKYVVTYHNDTISRGLFGLFFELYRRTMMKVILNQAEKIIVTSLDYGKNSFLCKIYENNSDKIVEISNGVDIQRFSPINDGTKIRKIYNIENKKIILFVGGLDKPHFFKGVDILLQSFKKLNNSGYHLIIIGEGELKDDYMSKVDMLGLCPNITFAGRVSDEDLPGFYAACDVTVLPSITMGEAFGLVLVEAMATGKPVIASNLPGIRTVVDDGKNGYLVEPKDIDALTKKIQYLLENDDMCKKFGNNGRKKVEERYSWKKIGSKLEKIYFEII